MINLFISLAAALLFAQLIGTLYLYLANSALYETIQQINIHWVVPNEWAIEQLLSFKVAFFGASFFTFTLGLGISLSSLLAVFFWHRKNKYASTFIMGLAILSLASTYQIWLVIPLFLLIPTLITFLYKAHPLDKKPFITALITLLMTSILYFNHASSLIDFRDQYLLSNPTGTYLNNLYYRYTFYPAEVIKPLQQKIVKTFYIDAPSSLDSYKTAFINQGYVEHAIEPHILLKERNEQMIVYYKNVPLFKIEKDKFANNPTYLLQHIHKLTDDTQTLRQLILLSLLMSLTATVFAIFWVPFTTIFFIFHHSKAAYFACYTLFVIIILHSSIDNIVITKDNLNNSIISLQWKQRLAALKYIEKNKIEITQFKHYQHFITSPLIAERYWLAKNLAHSKNKDSFEDLLTLLNDPHPNVTCMALYALGNRKNKSHIKPILENTKKSTHWYVQLYAYNTLRKLGWKRIL